MDNNFSTQVKEIISYSREEALRLGNDFIGTEHLVLGLIRDGENTAIKVLKSLSVDLYELRKEIEMAVKDKTGKNIANINSLPLTKQAEKVIRITVLEAKALKSVTVESEHLMLNLMKKENNSVVNKGRPNPAQPINQKPKHPFWTILVETSPVWLRTEALIRL